MFDYAYSAVISAVSVFIFGFFVLIKGLNKREGTFFFFFCLSLAMWNIGETSVFFNNAPNIAIIIQRISYAFASIMPFIYFHYIRFSLNQRSDIRLTVILLITSITLLCIATTSLVISDISFSSGIQKITKGPLIVLYYIYICILGSYIIYILSTFAKKNIKARYNLFAFVPLLIALIIYATNMLTLIRIPIEHYFEIIFVTIMAYAILKHDLMDISVAITRTTSFIATLIAYALLFCLSLLFPPGLEQTLYQGGFLLFTGFTFNRVRLFVQTSTEQKFIKGFYKPEDVMQKMTEEMVKIDSIKQLATNLSKRLLFFIQPAYTMFFSNRQLVYKKKAFPEFMKQILPEVMEINKKSPDGFRKYLPESTRIIIPIHVDGEVYSLVYLGPKASEAAYTAKDIRLLNHLRQQLSLLMSVIESTQARVIALEAERLKAMNDELGRKNTKLEQVLVELHQTQDKLIEEEQLSAMGHIAGEVAHDIRNPLSSMNRLITYLLDEKSLRKNESMLVDTFQRVSEAPIENQATVLETVKGLLSNNIEITNTLHKIKEINVVLRKIANDFLDYSRTSKDIPTTYLVLSEILRGKQSEYFAECQHRGIDLQLNIQTEKRVLLFPHQIERIFGNIMDNAMKACEETGEGGKSVQVDVTQVDEGKFVVLTIRDTGIGIEPDQIDKIFKPFYTKRKNLQGTGLGLAIVKKIVEDAGGTVHVTSELGTGTCFKVNLPCWE